MINPSDIRPRFTLNVYDDKELGWIVSDDRSHLGGTDLRQRAAFAHLFPQGFCEWVFRELLYEMAELHGWDVRVTEKPITK